MLVDYLKANHPHIKKITFMTVLEDIAKATRTSWIYVSISMTLVLVLNGCFSQQAIENLPVMALVGQLSDM